ncbi:MAG TPA: hypothetical protein ENI87_10280 [bacterium]|nr:hypothetical protein [bacterium]
MNPETKQRGGVLALAIHVLLLLLVLGQVVFLSSRYHARIDLTSDRLWTSTDTTRRLLARLDQRLLVEAYFSPKEELPVAYRTSREWADSFLEELRELGAGKVVVRRFDPNSDKAVADKATRLGVEPINLSSRSATSLSVDQHWQGLRLVYGGGKQQVLASFLPRSSFEAEAIVSPKIKQLLTERKRRFGYMEWPAQRIGSRQPGGVGWSAVRTRPGLKERYEFQNFKDEDGALLPDDLDTLFLFRPKDLTDRQKYVIDQFLMGGGTLVVFADAAEYALGPKRLMVKLPMRLDASGSSFSFVEQLRHYGVDWRPKVLADMERSAHTGRIPQEYFAVPVQTALGTMRASPVPYPYFFHAVNVDWSVSADRLATDATGKVDQRKAEQYRRTLLPGMPTDDFLFAAFKKLGRSPGFYWPTWTGLRRRAAGELDLPDGVEGRVLLWSSPGILLDDPQQNLNPVGSDRLNMRNQLERFLKPLNERLLAETRMQAPLMVELSGRFPSFFASRERPLRPSEIKEQKARESEAQDGAKDEDAAQDQPDKAASAQQKKPKPKPEPGPQPAEPEPPAAVPSERAPRTAAEAAGRIVVVGDATFLRDDVIRGDYQKAGGPYSGLLAMPFFAQLLDWLSGDRDLIELQSRTERDRTLTLLEPEGRPGADPREAEQRLRRKTELLVTVNVVLPCALLLLFGAGVFLVRRNQKRAFLGRLDGATR